MRCIACDRDAAVVPEHDGVRVGICRIHLKAYLDAVADSDRLAAIERAAKA